jgi:pimeloyl-ACP methyl ester carboxylesterase
MKRGVVILLMATGAIAQEHIAFPTFDGSVLDADVYGKGERVVILAHGGRFTKESWDKQARILADAGFQAVAVDFRPELADKDVLAAVRFVRKNGAKSVSIVGGSMGGTAAADASIASQPGEIDRVVILAASTGGPAEKIKGRKLFIVARDDASADGLRLPEIRANYEKAEDPKKLVILQGSAHAQFLFATDQGERLMREILDFLSAP